MKTEHIVGGTVILSLLIICATIVGYQQRDNDFHLQMGKQGLCFVHPNGGFGIWAICKEVPK
ncbi:hypothetical protein [Methylobacter sp.]|uniref:hypothetical protein n=1 Tax=Methylobacter sp. TaxID=2051955 RepID=UPI0012011F68|nr:hypothetical protein [Methylobacter sp.]TAK59541.1 MAG: hypothetical protein EPO18_20480 [Methylobacter sp.]